MADRKIEFSIPGLYEHFEFNRMFLERYYFGQPEKINDDISITSVYGSFPCIWNGGRIVKGDITLDQIEEIVKYYNSRGISLRYTFTNNLLDEYDLYDHTCNNIIGLTDQIQTITSGINYYKKELRDYIAEGHKDKFYYLASTTLGLNNLDTINELSKDTIIIPDYSLNNKFDIISKFENKNNIEFLVAEMCVDNCPYRKDHYIYKSKVQLGEENKPWSAPCGKGMYYYVVTKREHYISLEDIREKYLPLGFTNFKLVGRNENVINVVERFIKYFIKPEYQDEVRNEILFDIFESLVQNS